MKEISNVMELKKIDGGESNPYYTTLAYPEEEGPHITSLMYGENGEPPLPNTTRGNTSKKGRSPLGKF